MQRGPSRPFKPSSAALHCEAPLLRPHSRLGGHFASTPDRTRSKISLNSVGKLFPRSTGHGNSGSGQKREGSEAKRRANESRRNGRGTGRGGGVGGKTMGQRQRWKPPLLQSAGTMDSQTDTSCLPLYRPVSVYCRGEIAGQIKARSADFRPRKSRPRLIRPRYVEVLAFAIVLIEIRPVIAV